jgi:hypothetical protein
MSSETWLSATTWAVTIPLFRCLSLMAAINSKSAKPSSEAPENLRSALERLKPWAPQAPITTEAQPASAEESQQNQANKPTISRECGAGFSDVNFVGTPAGAQETSAP